MPAKLGRSQIVVLVAMLLCLAGSAGAESGDATDAAFAALLSMPGVQPREGGWLIPEQNEPIPESEQELIARLQRLKKTGANFNAIRHRGTLLAHAIRAGKERTAIWLLGNGADPKRVVFSESNPTAYDLALQYKRAAVIKLLESKHSYRPKKPTAPYAGAPMAAAYANAERPASPQSRQQQAIALMYRLVGPTLYPSEAAQQERQKFAATLSGEEYVALFRDGAHLDGLIRLVRNTEGGLEDALSRLPLEVVRRNAQQIADLVSELSHLTYSYDPKMRYSSASLSWPALWRRIDKPLSYDQRHDYTDHFPPTSWPGLAGRIPPTLWPGLFASGYSRHDAEVTGCLLSVVDVAAFKTLWPDFQRYFADARERAPALVLGKYRVSREQSPCYYSSGPADTVAKLAFLREQGVTHPVTGLRKSLLIEARDPALVAMADAFSPRTQGEPRLVKAPPVCKLALNDVWLNALINVKDVGWGIPADYVQVIDVPVQVKCGLVVSGDSYFEMPEKSDDFFYGPQREGSTRCGDLPDDGSIWIEESGRIRAVKINADTRGGGFTLRQVRDTQSGKRYLLNAGQRGAMCSLSSELSDAYEWQTGPKGPELVSSRDSALIERLLREQCEESLESGGFVCRGIDRLAERGEAANSDSAEPMGSLSKGDVVYIRQLVDQLGVGRRKAYEKVITAHDRTRIRQMTAAGIPWWWTAAEIRALGSANLPLEEKRRRVALLFANQEQLGAALNGDRYDLPEALLTWLPDQDWGPVLRVIGRSPDLWYEAARSLLNKAEEASRSRLACEIERAQGFLCGGGIEFD